jgi:7-keto-8-aminopelargonate synthetase-like enzyme
MDGLAHACLQEGASSATKNVHKYSHLNNDHAEKLLQKIRDQDAHNAILVITKGLFSMDSDSPDIAALQEICHSYGASLLVDVAHDLGALGPNGTGQLGQQGQLSEVDFVMGAFSKTFASNGGFLATNESRVKQYLRWFACPWTFSNALSPIQCSIVSKSIDIVRSHEGDDLRRDLMGMAKSFRSELAKVDLKYLGEPSAIIPVLIGKETIGRLASKELAQRGVFANLVEFPAVGLGAARFRCQLMATHRVSHVQEAAKQIAGAIERAYQIDRGVTEAGLVEAAV